VTMLVNVRWGAGALVVAAYMVVALLRPDKF
jgi:K+-transporting ATPase KdpF subunit